jgi:hypothetical protein
MSARSWSFVFACGLIICMSLACVSGVPSANPTPTTAVRADQSSAAPESTTVLPSATVAASPTANLPEATAVNSPTVNPPTATMIISPTVNSTTAVPTAALSSDGALVPPQTDTTNPCANVLYPFIPNNQWVYIYSDEANQDTDQQNQIGINVAGVEKSQAMVQMLHVGTAATSTGYVQCDQGAILDVPFMLLGDMFVEASGNVVIKRTKGVFVPAYSTFAEKGWNLTWEGEYIASGTLTVTSEGDTMRATLKDSPLKLSWKTSGAGEKTLEDIVVKAGSFPRAIKLKRTLTLQFSLTIVSDGDTMSIPATLIMNNTLWYAPNVGMLKQKVDSAQIVYRGIKSPVMITKSLELAQFIPAE